MDEDYAEDDALRREWLGQDNLTFGGMIAVGLLMVQPFLTADSVDLSGKVCVGAFAVAIPLLAALIMVNRQEVFRGRATTSWLVKAAKSLALSSGFIGVVAGFWHIWPTAGVIVAVTGMVAVGVHSAGYARLEYLRRPRPKD